MTYVSNCNKNVLITRCHIDTYISLITSPKMFFFTVTVYAKQMRFLSLKAEDKGSNSVEQINEEILTFTLMVSPDLPSCVIFKITLLFSENQSPKCVRNSLFTVFHLGLSSL